MPQDLAALLVEEGAVSKADMDRAVARQSQQGGALDTALLELGLIAEGQLLSFLAQASGLPSASVEALKEVDARARRVFPAKVAERHRLAPFALDGRELAVVACHPVDGAAIDEIGFMLSLTLVPHVLTEWRVHDLIHRLYGGQLSSRFAKLADAALLAPAPAAPPESGAPTGPAASGGGAPALPAPGGPNPATAAPAAPSAAMSIEEAFFAAGEAGTFTPAPAALPPLEPAPPPAAPLPPPPGPEASTAASDAPGAAADEASFADIEPERPKPSGFGGDGAEPAEPLLAALEQAVDAYDALWGDSQPLSPAAGPEAAPAEPSPAEPPVAAAEPPSLPAPAEGAAPQEPGAPPEPEEPEEPPAELDRTSPPRWSIDDARTALAAARHRDEVVLVALRYARDFFEFAALFAVTRDAVVGHDALGPQEDERSRCRATALYASDPGIVRTVLETRAPYLGPAARDAVGTTNVLDGLWRGTPRTVLLYPILVADRPVAVLFADNGEAPVSPRRLGDLLLFLSTVGPVFERIIRSRKKRRRREPPPAAPPPPAVESPTPDASPDWMEPPPSDSSAEPVAPSAPADAGPTEPTGVAELTDPAGPSQAESAGVVEPPEGARSAEPPPEPVAPPPAPAPQGAPADRVAEALAVLLAGAPGSDPAAPILDLLLDGHPDVAAAAREALAAHRRHAAVKPIPERLRRALLSEVGDRPLLAARALGALRDVESIPILIQALEGGSPDAAAEALEAITLQRFGVRPRNWLKWWKENRSHTRAEWLFAALTAEKAEARIAAAAELRAAGEPPVRYSPDLPSAELEAASRAWWVWWSRQGIDL